MPFRELAVAYLANLPEEEKAGKQKQLSLSTAALDSVARSMESAGHAAQPHGGGRLIIHTSVKFIKVVFAGLAFEGWSGHASQHRAQEYILDCRRQR